MSLLTFWIASVLFFLSGGTGLAYQVAWFKRFSHVWGNSSLAMAAVVASFLFGLGLGAHLIGRVADRLKSCLFWYGASEVAIGALAALIPFEIQGLHLGSSAIYPLFQGAPLLQSAVRFFFTLLVIGPACFLMGGTLPLLIKHLTPPDSGPRQSTGWLYAINTLGAAAGCYVTGFHLLPSLGLFRTNLIVAGLNGVIGVVAILASLARWGAPEASVPVAASPRGGPGSPAPAPVARHAAGAGEPRRLWPLYATVALTGCGSLILEMVWTRQLAVMLGGSTYSFTAMLFLLLVGIGAGSMIFHLTLKGSPDLTRVPAAIIAGLGLFTLLGKLLIPQSSIIVGLLKDLRAEQGWNAAVAVGASAVLELLPAVAMGILFPVFVALTRSRAAETGKAVGAIYAWNTLGSIAAASFTSLFLIPLLDSAKTTAVALGMYAVALVLITPRPRTLRAAAAYGFALILICHSALFSLGRADPRETDLGFYMYGYSGAEKDRHKVAFFKEGAAANVLVTEQTGHYSLRVNGKVDASTQHDMAMQLGCAYFPIFLSPEARSLLVIGFGSGTTSGGALLFPETRVTCCEIEPEVFRASETFAAVNHRPQDSPRFKVVFDDGRSHLQGSREKYDLIISEPSNPWLAGISNLFTREFYQVARDRLAPRGILVQWLQVYSFSASDYALVTRTLLSVFPECVLVRISAGDTMLLASQVPLSATSVALDRSQAMIEQLPLVQADLRHYYATTDVRTLLIKHMLLDRGGLERLVAGDPLTTINSDLNMKLEFDAPLRLFSQTDTAAQVMTRILAGAQLDWFARATAEWGLTKNQAPVFHDLLSLFDRAAQKELMEGLVDLGLQLDPELPELIVDKLGSRPPQDTTELERAADKLLAVSQKEVNRLGVSLFRAGHFQQAVKVFQRVLAAYPWSLTAWNNLAIAYEAWGKLDEAEAMFQKAISVDPMNDATRKSFDAFHKKHAARKQQGDQPAAEPARSADSAGGETPPGQVDGQ